MCIRDSTCGISMFLYGFCGFLPTVHFGILLCSMLLMALLGDLILLPALLAAFKTKRDETGGRLPTAS